MHMRVFPSRFRMAIGFYIFFFFGPGVPFSIIFFLFGRFALCVRVSSC